MQPAAERTATGRFLPGNTTARLGGRPKAIDFRALVHEARGDTVRDKLIAVFDMLAEKAAAGDVNAAKLLLERICGKDADEIKLTDERQEMPEEEFAKRVVSLLAILQARRQSGAN
jgi:hypothetical protein